MKTASLPNLNRQSTSFPSFYSLYQDHVTTLNHRPLDEENEASETSPFNDSILPLNEIGLLVLPSSVEMFGNESGNFTQLRLDQTLPSTSSVGSNQLSQSIRDQQTRSDDGYNWRKYGQKQVKGSENPKSYYKCTYPNCPTKKKVERSLDGQITEIVWKGNHNHPKPQSTRRSSSATIQNSNHSNSEIPDQSYASHGTGQMDSATLENSSVLIGDDDFDGYNWRKYWQKQVKGSENPKSYYKCTYPNCPTKKKVERSLDGQITEIVYKGNHNHLKPQSTRRSSSAATAASSQAIQNSNHSDSEIPYQSYASHGTGQMDSATPENSSVLIGDDDFDGSPRKSKSGGGDEFDDEEPDAKRWKIEEGEN